MIYIIGVKEIWEQSYKIDATSIDEALKKIEQGEGELLEDHFYYCNTEPKEMWRV